MGTVPPRPLPPMGRLRESIQVEETEDGPAIPLVSESPYIRAGVMSLDEARAKMDLPSENPYNGMTLEEAFDHAIKANKWEYLRVQMENWLSGGFSLSNVVDALTRAFGKRDKPPAIVEDEPQEMLVEYEYE